ncbi:MAG: SPOR domain-containing protein [Candidatus Cloacimonetes bacterium]|nr:SPOR domain-containing protein [Candidatus Cloacimonadota bacterium]
MRKISALIVLIIAIAALIIIIGFIIASVAHKYKSVSIEKLIAEQPDTMQVVSQLEEDYLPGYEEIFALQIFASNKYSKVEHLMNKLKKAGYKTKISKLKKEGEIIYRLRMEGLYQEDEAIALGNELKKKYPSINSYWLDEIETEYAKVERPEIKKEEKEIISKIPHEETITEKKKPKEFEIQIMASGDYSKVEEVKSRLEKIGYKTKILTLTKGSNIIYRLRLRGLYPEKEAITFGNKIIKDSPLITEYWLDEIKEGKSVATTSPIVSKKETTTTRDTGKKEFEIQLLANRDRSVVEKRKKDLQRFGYDSKIFSTTVKGVRYYRLRLVDVYSRSEANRIGEKLKEDVKFINDFWIVKKGKQQTQTYIEEKDESLTEPIVTSMDPKYQPKSVNYTMTCKQDNVNIHIGPGTHYAVDPIGKLMKGITVFIVEEKNNWVRFTITPGDKYWSSWVKKDLLE